MQPEEINTAVNDIKNRIDVIKNSEQYKKLAIDRHSPEQEKQFKELNARITTLEAKKAKLLTDYVTIPMSVLGERRNTLDKSSVIGSNTGGKLSSVTITKEEANKILSEKEKMTLNLTKRQEEMIKSRQPVAVASASTLKRRVVIMPGEVFKPVPPTSPILPVQSKPKNLLRGQQKVIVNAPEEPKPTMYKNSARGMAAAVATGEKSRPASKTPVLKRPGMVSSVNVVDNTRPKQEMKPVTKKEDNKPIFTKEDNVLESDGEL